MELKIKLLTADAIMPTKGTKEAACYDLYVNEDTKLFHNECVLVKTGVAMGIPEGYCVRVYGRSSMCKRGIAVLQGVVDSDYTGEVRVQAVNFGCSTPVVVKKGERIGQFKLVKLEPTELVLSDELRKTERGDKGWGSTGL